MNHEYTPEFVARFWTGINKDGSIPRHCPELGPCWERPASKGGYGRVKFKGKSYNPHRVSYELTFGPFDNKLFVCHKCDHRSCVNPLHLFLGTQADNMEDKVSKGRAASGERHGMSKLHDADIAAIRDRFALGGITKSELGRQYNVSHWAIRDILNGRTHQR